MRHKSATLPLRVWRRPDPCRDRSRVFALHVAAQPVPVVGREPSRLLGSIGQVEEGQHAEHHRREALDQEQPLPAVETGEPVQLQERFGDRCADHHRDRGGGHEEGAGPGPLAGGDPIREVEDHSGEEAGLGQAEQDAQRVEAGSVPSPTPWPSRRGPRRT